jgi:hypothetical protein
MWHIFQDYQARVNRHIRDKICYFHRPLRDEFIFTRRHQPLRSWLISIRRSATRLH